MEGRIQTASAPALAPERGRACEEGDTDTIAFAGGVDEFPDDILGHACKVTLTAARIQCAPSKVCLVEVYYRTKCRPEGVSSYQKTSYWLV